MEPDEIGTTKLKVEPPCPHCGKNLDGVTGAKQGPSPMDATVCAYCLNWLIFKDDLQLRMMSEEEIVSLTDETFERLSKYTKIGADYGLGKKKGE